MPLEPASQSGLPFDQKPRPAITPAHVPLVILGGLLILAFLLAVVLGDINESTFRQPVPTTSDAITIP